MSAVQNFSITTATPNSGSFMTVNSANQFNTEAAFQYHIISSLRQAQEYHEFLYTDVPRSWGEVILQVIDEKISSRHVQYEFESCQL
ncbi:uncharacterized protein N7483_006135 [Penicillium malachiteum]|uniref:uncharacterized protein n=1 Tax=Penicillium malachiteum TaxID=1324776 RepID=UPI002548602B|nr:uncharacterized protein N7483_006135 [Penicillium malachiteum]KAJ5731627.1 hypothetical protein N7483_006135 [Penicillium malachiteum]